MKERHPKKIAPVYKTSDGQEFEKQAEADAHQDRLNKLEAYENARNALAHAFVREMKTADGHLFDGGDYYHVYDWPFPRVHSVMCTGWYSQEFQMQSDGSIALVERREFNTGRDVQLYPINTLYKSKAAAQAAMIEKLKEKVVELQEQIAKAQPAT